MAAFLSAVTMVALFVNPDYRVGVAAPLSGSFWVLRTLRFMRGND